MDEDDSELSEPPPTVERMSYGDSPGKVIPHVQEEWIQAYVSGSFDVYSEVTGEEEHDMTSEHPDFASKLIYPSVTSAATFADYIEDVEHLSYEELYQRLARVDDCLITLHKELQLTNKQIEEFDIEERHQKLLAEEELLESKRRAVAEWKRDDDLRQKVRRRYAQELKLDGWAFWQFLMTLPASQCRYKRALKELKDARFVKRIQAERATKEAEYKKMVKKDYIAKLALHLPAGLHVDEKSKAEIDSDRKLHRGPTFMDPVVFDDQVTADAYGFERNRHPMYYGRQSLPNVNARGDRFQSSRNRQARNGRQLNDRTTSPESDNGERERRVRRPRQFPEDFVPTISRSATPSTTPASTPTLRGFRKRGRPAKSKLQDVSVNAADSDAPYVPNAGKRSLDEFELDRDEVLQTIEDNETDRVVKAPQVKRRRRTKAQIAAAKEAEAVAALAIKDSEPSLPSAPDTPSVAGRSKLLNLSELFPSLAGSPLPPEFIIEGASDASGNLTVPKKRKKRPMKPENELTPLSSVHSFDAEQQVSEYPVSQARSFSLAQESSFSTQASTMTSFPEMADEPTEDVREIDAQEHLRRERVRAEKSRKLSENMKKRWASGNMAAAQETRRANNLKKRADKEKGTEPVAHAIPLLPSLPEARVFPPHSFGIPTWEAKGMPPPNGSIQARDVAIAAASTVSASNTSPAAFPVKVESKAKVKKRASKPAIKAIHTYEGDETDAKGKGRDESQDSLQLQTSKKVRVGKMALPGIPLPSAPISLAPSEPLMVPEYAIPPTSFSQESQARTTRTGREVKPTRRFGADGHYDDDDEDEDEDDDNDDTEEDSYAAGNSHVDIHMRDTYYDPQTGCVQVYGHLPDVDAEGDIDGDVDAHADAWGYDEGDASMMGYAGHLGAVEPWKAVSEGY